MIQPKISRPRFPPGYIEHPTSLLPWSHVEQRLAETKIYWLCSVRPDGRPHAIPLWGGWVGGRIYFDGSPDTRHARNIASNPQVTVHLESGDNVIIVNGRAQALPKPSLEVGRLLSQAYIAKYAALGYAPTPEQWDHGGLLEVTPYTVLAWTSFTQDPTRFVLAP